MHWHYHLRKEIKSRILNKYNDLSNEELQKYSLPNIQNPKRDKPRNKMYQFPIQNLVNDYIQRQGLKEHQLDLPRRNRILRRWINHKILKAQRPLCSPQPNSSMWKFYFQSQSRTWAAYSSPIIWFRNQKISGPSQVRKISKVKWSRLRRKSRISESILRNFYFVVSTKEIDPEMVLSEVFPHCWDPLLWVLRARIRLSHKKVIQGEDYRADYQQSQHNYRYTCEMIK